MHLCPGGAETKLDRSLPAASLNNPVQSVHSGVCGSASSLSPEAVDTKRERETYVALKFESLIEDEWNMRLVAWKTQDMPLILPVNLIR